LKENTNLTKWKYTDRLQQNLTIKKSKINNFQQFCKIDLKNCLYSFFALRALLTQVKFLQIKYSDRGSIQQRHTEEVLTFHYQINTQRKPLNLITGNVIIIGTNRPSPKSFFIK